MSDTITVRVSVRAHRIFQALAAARGQALTEYLGRLAEQERRQDILDQSSARMTELMADHEEHRVLEEELRLTEAMTANALRQEPPYE